MDTPRLLPEAGRIRRLCPSDDRTTVMGHIRAMSFDEVLYQTVAARQAQQNSMAWEVPALSMTAQAFLFTIALAADSTATSRYVACGLSILTSVLTITLMARHRQMDIADAEWLEAFERRQAQLPPTGALPITEHRVISGNQARARRDQIVRQRVAKGLVGRLVPLLPGYSTWVIGLALFALTAAAIIVITAANPRLLGG